MEQGLYHGLEQGLQHGTVAAYNLTGTAPGLYSTDTTMSPTDTFIATWKTDITTANVKTLQLPLTAPGSGQLGRSSIFYIDWGDGKKDFISGSTNVRATHTYAAPGTYTTKITGTFQQFDGLANESEALKLISIERFGCCQAWYFGRCSNLSLNNVKDIPNLNAASGFYTSLSSYFYNDSTITTIPLLDTWDVSKVTNMSNMFQFCTNINSPLNSWKTSNVTNMISMFSFAYAFNQPLNNWNVSNVVYMSYMFDTCLVFNQPLDSWNVSKVTDMSGMFNYATAFNQDIGNWNVSSVTSFNSFMANKSTEFSSSYLDSIYNGWIQRELKPSLSIDFGTIKYTTSGSEGKALLNRSIYTAPAVISSSNDAGRINISLDAVHNLTTGNKVFIKDVVPTYINGLWSIITGSISTQCTLSGSVYGLPLSSPGTIITSYGWSVADGSI